MRTIIEAHRAIMNGLTVQCSLTQRGPGGGRKSKSWGPDQYGSEGAIYSLKQDVEAFRDAHRPYYDVRWTTRFDLADRFVLRRADGRTGKVTKTPTPDGLYVLVFDSGMGTPVHVKREDFNSEWELVDEELVGEYLASVYGADNYSRLTPRDAHAVLQRAHQGSWQDRVIWDRWAFGRNLRAWYLTEPHDFVKTPLYKVYNRQAFEKALAEVI